MVMIREGLGLGLGLGSSLLAQSTLRTRMKGVSLLLLNRSKKVDAHIHINFLVIGTGFNGTFAWPLRLTWTNVISSMDD